MAKKRRRSKKDESIIGPMVLIVFGSVYYWLDSWQIAVAASVLFLIVCGVIAFLIKEQKATKLRNSGIAEIDRMDGVQFEHYLAALFKGMGYKTEVTKASGDYGADLILVKNNEKTVVQAKRYKSNIGIKAVQEISSARLHYQATSAWVVTNSNFTKAAVELAQSNNVRLIGREELIKTLSRFNAAGGEGSAPSAKQIRKTVAPKPVKCPQCDSMMVLREGKRGPFYGCKSYPHCKAIKSL